MCKRMFISLVVLLTLSSITLADITQAQSSNVGVSSTDPVATNWAVSQYANGDSTSVGTQTQTINVYSSSSDSDSPFLGHLPSSLLFSVGAQSMPSILNGSILLGGLGGSSGLSAGTQNLTTLPLLFQLSHVSGLSGLSSFNPVSGGIAFP